MVLSIRKTVRFSSVESVCEFESLPPLCLEESLWYQPMDYLRMRQELLVALEEAKRDKMSVCIPQNYGLEDFNAMQMLILWANIEDTKRGLERFVNEEYGSQRLLHRRKAVDAVLYAQEKLRKDDGRTDARAASIIQTVSSTLSANAIKFAHMLAIADHEAVVMFHNNTNTNISVGNERRLLVEDGVKSPPKGKSPVSARKHTQRPSTSMQRPPRHPGPTTRREIRVSTKA